MEFAWPTRKFKMELSNVFNVAQKPQNVVTTVTQTVFYTIGRVVIIFVLQKLHCILRYKTIHAFDMKFLTTISRI